MTVYVIILMLSLLFSGLSSDYKTSRKLELEGTSIKRMEIDCGSGFLKIYGNSELKKIEVSAEIEVKNMDPDKAEDYLEKSLRLRLERKGSKAVLKTDHDHSIWEDIFGDRPQVSVNLTVRIPSKMDIEIDDGSGMILVEKIDGNVRLDDGSGETTISEISGDVWVDDGSGELHLSDIGGNVDIDDGSGDIMVSQVAGNVRIDDGSGSIFIRKVEQDVIIVDDGSGRVDISDVKGTVKRWDD